MFFFGPCLSLDIPGPVTPRFSQVDLLLTEEVRKEEKIARCDGSKDGDVDFCDEETLIFCCGIYWKGPIL